MFKFFGVLKAHINAILSVLLVVSIALIPFHIISYFIACSILQYFLTNHSRKQKSAIYLGILLTLCIFLLIPSYLFFSVNLTFSFGEAKTVGDLENAIIQVLFILNLFYLCGLSIYLIMKFIHKACKNKTSITFLMLTPVAISLVLYLWLWKILSIFIIALR